MINSSKIDTGKNGERIAVDFLKKNGYAIIETNFKNYLGEIDIIARDKGVICFVEVRARRAPARTEDILDSIGRNKQFRLSRLALSFLEEKKLVDVRARFDIVSVRFSDEGDDVNIFKDAFEVCQKYT